MTVREPADAADRRAVAPVICYDVENLPFVDMGRYEAARQSLDKVHEVVIAPRDAQTFEVDAGQFFRIRSVDGPQVGDLNLFNRHDLTERFFSGKTRQLHATHLTKGNQMWSNLPNLRSMATITHDTLEWYGFDADGGSVHDVIGTRCDPYTQQTLNGAAYHNCCHSNLSRALSDATGQPLADIEQHVHDVLNVFMCTGFTRDTQQYFMKASPVRPGDFIEFVAEIDLLGALSACPGGDCSTSHSDDEADCYPCLLYTSPSPRDKRQSRMPSSA